MNDILALAFGVGLQDGLNPCIMMAGTFLIMGSFLFQDTPIKIFLIRVFFVFLYLLSVFLFNFSPLQLLLFNKFFIVFAKGSYLILALAAIFLGGIFLKSWVDLRSDRQTICLYSRLKPIFKINFNIYFIVTLSAIFLGSLATLWPINSYFMILGNEALLKGNGLAVFLPLLVYALVQGWVLWLLLAVVSVTRIPKTTLHIIYAGICFSTASSLIFLWK